MFKVIFYSGQYLESIRINANGSQLIRVLNLGKQLIKQDFSVSEYPCYSADSTLVMSEHFSLNYYINKPDNTILPYFIFPLYQFTNLIFRNSLTLSAPHITASAYDITVSAPHITVSACDITVSAYDITASACDITASACDITASAYDITVSACDITASACDINLSAQFYACFFNSKLLYYNYNVILFLLNKINFSLI